MRQPCNGASVKSEAQYISTGIQNVANGTTTPVTVHTHSHTDLSGEEYKCTGVLLRILVSWSLYSRPHQNHFWLQHRAIFVTKTKTRIITLRSVSTKTRIMTICETKTI